MTKPNSSLIKRTRRTAAPAEAPSAAERLRKLVPALLLVAVAATAFGMVAVDRRALSPAGEEAKAQSVTVRRDLPAGVTEDQVPKWIPIRQPSGRTELVPWTSVGGETARDPNAIERVMAVGEAPAESASHDAEAVAEAAEPSPETDRGGLFTRVRARLLGVEPSADAPGGTEKVAEDVQSGGSEAESAALAVDPGDRRLDDPAPETAGDR